MAIVGVKPNGNDWLLANALIYSARNGNNQ